MYPFSKTFLCIASLCFSPIPFRSSALSSVLHLCIKLSWPPTYPTCLHYIFSLIERRLKQKKWRKNIRKRQVMYLYVPLCTRVRLFGVNHIVVLAPHLVKCRDVGMYPFSKTFLCIASLCFSPIPFRSSALSSVLHLCIKLSWPPTYPTCLHYIFSLIERRLKQKKWRKNIRKRQVMYLYVPLCTPRIAPPVLKPNHIDDQKALCFGFHSQSVVAYLRGHKERF